MEEVIKPEKNINTSVETTVNIKFGMTLVITLLSYFVILMDNSIVFTSSLQIGESLQLDSAHLAWVSNAYTITFGGFLLLAGRLSDLLGRKRIFSWAS